MSDFETINETTSKARKAYRCCICGCIIEKGTIYNYQTGMFNGQIETCRKHKECDELRRIFDVWEYDDVIDILNDTISSNYPSNSFENEIDEEIDELNYFEQVKRVLQDIKAGILVETSNGYFERKD